MHRLLSLLIVLPAALLAADPAQLMAEAKKRGPVTFEVSQVLSTGIIIRPAQKLGSGSLLFTGSPLYLRLDPKATLPKVGTRVKDQLLYPAGQVTVHPVSGDAQPMPAVAFTLESATQAPPSSDVYEPLISVIEQRGLGFALSTDGLVLVEHSLLKDATDISIDIGKDRAPGVIVSSEPTLGYTVLRAKGPLKPARLAPRGALEVNQVLLAIHFTLQADARALVAPTAARCVVTQRIELKRPLLDHDAAPVAQALGGLLITEQCDVVGLLPGTPDVRAAKGSSLPTTFVLPPVSPTTALRTEMLLPFLSRQPKIEAHRQSTELRLNDALALAQASTLVVKVTREIRTERGPGAPIPAGAGWSLSKSGLRHNSGCKFYNATYPCEVTAGRPCKVCGG
jgi:hypothetical protein